MNHRLRGVMVELNKLVQQPSTKTSLQRLRETFDLAQPLAQWVGPAQTVCNYWNYDWTLLSEHLSERDQVGFQQRIQLVNMPRDQFVQTPLDAYSGQQANGRAGPIGDPQTGDTPGEFDPHNLPILHGNVYMPTGQPNFGQFPDCQAGQAGYPLGRFPVPGQAKFSPANVQSDIPGSRGITDVFWNAKQRRVLKDTRIPSHQP